MTDMTPEKLIRGWAKAYRDTPDHRFPSDPHAEFFPIDLELAADEIARLIRALTQIDTLATCTGIVDPAQHKNMLDNIYRIAREALRGGPVGSTREGS